MSTQSPQNARTPPPFESQAPGVAAGNPAPAEQFQWTTTKLGVSLSLFILAAAAEVGGGWLIWQAIRETDPWWWGLLGALILILYGFVPTFQPISNFGRTFAAYGGFFIVYSYGWGWALDKQRPDTGTP